MDARTRYNAKRRASYNADPAYRAHILARSRASWVRRRDKIAAQRRRRRYGVTPQQYDAMLARQGNACACCRDPFTRRCRDTSPAVDHCHASGRVRGILCGRCNKAAGFVRDDPRIAARLVAYLRRHQRKRVKV